MNFLFIFKLNQLNSLEIRYKLLKKYLPSGRFELTIFRLTFQDFTTALFNIELIEKIKLIKCRFKKLNFDEFINHL